MKFLNQPLEVMIRFLEGKSGVQSHSVAIIIITTMHTVYLDSLQMAYVGMRNATQHAGQLSLSCCMSLDNYVCFIGCSKGLKSSRFYNPTINTGTPADDPSMPAVYATYVPPLSHFTAV